MTSTITGPGPKQIDVKTLEELEFPIQVEAKNRH
jgi:hypothetical protein